MKYALLGVLIAGCGSTPSTAKAPEPSPVAPDAATSAKDRTVGLGFLEGDWQDEQGRLWGYRADGVVIVARLVEPPTLLVIQSFWFRIPDEATFEEAPPAHDDHQLHAELFAEHEHQCLEKSLAPGEVRFTCSRSTERPPPPPVTEKSTTDEILAATTVPPPIVIPLAYRREGDTLLDVSRADAPRSARRGTGTSAPAAEAIDRATQLFADAPGVANVEASRRDDTGTLAAVIGTWTPSPGTRLAPGGYVRLWRRTAAGWTVVAQFPRRQVP